MQVFVPYSSALYVALTLDRRRLNKQIIECLQIQAVLRGCSTAWQFHPIVAMYRNHALWLEYYLNTLVAYRNGNLALAATYSAQAEAATPPFICKALCDNHKRRLYTKSPEFYPQFALLGTTTENWYIIDAQLRIYENGKLKTVREFALTV